MKIKLNATLVARKFDWETEHTFFLTHDMHPLSIFPDYFVEIGEKTFEVEIPDDFNFKNKQFEQIEKRRLKQEILNLKSKIISLEEKLGEFEE